MLGFYRAWKVFLILAFVTISPVATCSLGGTEEAVVLSPGLWIDVSGKSIELRAKDIALGSLLRSVRQKSGIGFKIPKHLENDLVTIRIVRPNWTEIVKTLLTDYNTVVFWEDNKRVIARIWLVDRIKHNSVSFTDSKNPSTKNNAQQTAAFPRNIPIPLQKLQQLVKVAPGTPFPIILFSDPDIRNFLSANGVEEPKDWGKIHLAGVVRRQAERHVNEMLYRQQHATKKG